MEGDARDSFKATVRQHGILVPVIRYRGELLDGQNRISVVEELNADGETLNGKPYEVPVTDFDGTPLEALDLSLDQNFDGRRHLSPSQKAAIGVKAQSLAERYLKAEGRKVRPGSNAKAKETPELTIQWLANRVGVSTAMVKQAKAVGVADPKLLDKVASGAVKLGGAYAKVRARKARAEKKRVDQANGAAGDDRAAAAGVVKPAERQAAERNGVSEAHEPVAQDGLGNPIPPDSPILKAMAAREDYDELLDLLSVARSHARSIKAGEAGDQLELPAVERHIKLLRKLVRDAKPWCACRVCDPAKPTKKCEECRGCGYLTKGEWKRLTRSKEDESTAA
jgi:hypothetical protein